MIAENIRNARKAKGVSQERLASELHVVRQTVSKWENGLSVPDADELLCLARALDVSVDELLDVPPRNEQGDELARLNAALTRLEQERCRTVRAGKVRGAILFLSFLSMLLAFGVNNAAVSVALTAGCVLAALVVLYRNLALLTDPAADGPRLGALKLTTVFDAALIILAGAAVVLHKTQVIRFSDESERLLALAIVSAVMAFSGWVSPRLPYNRHTGLRLPWTVTDEQTWNVAHRALGYVALPLTVLYIAAALTIGNFEAVTLAAVALWVGVPGLISLVFWWRKFH